MVVYFVEFYIYLKQWLLLNVISRVGWIYSITIFFKRFMTEMVLLWKHYCLLHYFKISYIIPCYWLHISYGKLYRNTIRFQHTINPPLWNIGQTHIITQTKKELENKYTHIISRNSFQNFPNKQDKPTQNISTVGVNKK